MRRAFVSCLVALVALTIWGATAGTPAVRAQEDRPIAAWLVLGAFPVREGPDRLRHAYLEDEASSAPRPAVAVGSFLWRQRPADANGQMDLKVAIGEPPLEQAVAYAFSWVTTADERTVSFGFESDDDVRVWLNGTLILDREVARSLRGGTDTVTVRLARGANRLLMKVVNRTGEFALGARLLALADAPLDGLRLGATRPPDAPVASVPSPSLTVAPLSVAAFATLDAGTGALRVPVVARATRWGGLSGPVRLRVGSREAELPAAADGAVAEAELATTWDDLLKAASGEGDGVTANVVGGGTEGRGIDAGAVLRVLARPIAVDGWRWRDDAGTWHPLPRAGAYGVDATVAREARALAFEAPVPDALAGLTLEMDVAELATPEAVVRVDGEVRTPSASARVRLCGPCGAGASISVEVEPHGNWWDAPRLVVPDAGWTEIAEGARWARYFLGDSILPEVPDEEVARRLLAAAAAPDKARYRALVGTWMKRLEPAARQVRADTIDVVGNAHIDAAWLWRWEETVDVVRNTWRTAAKLLEKYPGATFAGSSAAYYAWLETYEPALLHEIQRLQREGRWAPVGGWWVEADANLPSGEALVRQALYGQRTYQRLFGRMATVAWIPDTFGYTWTLPQIFRKSGFDYFVTQKVRWNDTDTWSADRNLFWWEGRDGTRILSYIPYGYTHQLQPTSLAEEWKASRDSTASRHMLVLYGVGDHGGGPTMEMLDRARELERIPTFPPLRGTLPERALERMAADAEDVPVIDDELYLEYHRGVYTSQAEMKAWNRRLEALLGAAEAASAHAAFVGARRRLVQLPAWLARGRVGEDPLQPVPRPAPGVGDRSGLRGRRRRLPRGGAPGRHGAGARRRDRRRVARHALPRRGWAAVPRAEPLRVRAGRGGQDPVEGRGGPRGGRLRPRRSPQRVRADTLRALVPEVPPTGGRVVFVVSAGEGGDGGADGDAERAGPAGAAAAAGPVILENDRLHVEVDRATGELARIVDLASGREVLQPGGGGNRLETREDRPLQWDAWNIDDTDDPWAPIADTVRVGEPGRDALGRFVEVVRADRHGRFVQRLTLPDGARRLEVETRALWRADHRLLKASFPLALSFDSVWAEIPYGAIARPAAARSKRDSARYEVPMQRWIDASDGRWGVSFVNDAKHGYDVRGDTVRITLLKSAKWPDEQADMGTQVFRYDLVVHDGDWRSGATEAAATSLDQPLRAVAVEEHAGEGRARAFASVRGDGVQLGALKVAEDDASTLVVRLVERHGAAVTATLELPWPFEWRSADLLERPEAEAAWTESEGTRASIPLAPWEIGTVLVRRR